MHFTEHILLQNFQAVFQAPQYWDIQPLQSTSFSFTTPNLKTAMLIAQKSESFLVTLPVFLVQRGIPLAYYPLFPIIFWQ